METIKKYTLEQLKAVKPILSENEQLSIIAGRIEQGGYYFFTYEEMLEMYGKEIMFPPQYEDKLFEDTEESTEDHTVYIRYWYISISDYDRLMFSFSDPQGGGSIVIPSGGSHVNENGEMTEQEMAILAASTATNLCGTFYSFVKKEAKVIGGQVMEIDPFYNTYQPAIRNVVLNILKSGKTNVDARYISYRDTQKVSIKISNNYGITNEIFYNYR